MMSDFHNSEQCLIKFINDDNNNFLSSDTITMNSIKSVYDFYCFLADEEECFYVRESNADEAKEILVHVDRVIFHAGTSTYLNQLLVYVYE